MNPLQIIDLFFAIVVAVVNVNLYHFEDTPFPTTLDTVAYVQFTEDEGFFSYFGDPYQKCRYLGMLVPYERDWTEVEGRNGTEFVREPELGKIEAYAVVVNRKVCPGQDPEPVLLIANDYPAPWLKNFHERTIAASSPDNANPDNVPKWYPQAVRRIYEAVDTNPEAKKFVEFNLALAKTAKPEAAGPAVEAATQ